MKSDANCKAIVKALRDAGVSVDYWVPSGRQRGIPDLVCGHRGVSHLLEVKNANGKDEVSDDQRAWHDLWRGGPVHVVRTVEQALAAVGLTVTAQDADS